MALNVERSSILTVTVSLYDVDVTELSRILGTRGPYGCFDGDFDVAQAAESIETDVFEERNM